jgi:hypothetical protein
VTAQYLTIEYKERRLDAYLASLADFTVSPSDTVNADIVRDCSNISLYCLDDASKRAIFVELPSYIDLAKVPFVYQTQYEYAQRLIAVPYDTFRRIASTLPEIKHLIVIYMTGRSGSTLLSHLFNELDTVRSLSEPDVASHVVHLRSMYSARDTELRELLDSTVRFLCKPTMFKTPSTFALKLRNEATQAMDLFQDTFPQAKNLFMYRDAVGFITSYYRLFKRWQTPEYISLHEFVALWSETSNYDYTPLTAYLDVGTTEISIPQILTLWWLSVMEWYLAQQAQGVPVLAVRYHDLNTYREQTLREIFNYCDLPSERVPETLNAFARDAQAGTELARESPQEGNSLRLSDKQWNDVTKILQRHPTINVSDFIVPGTLRV